MKGIRFGNYHSFDDFHLILKPKELATPAVKVRKIEIEGADSSLDYTDFFGEAKFEDVTHTFEFATANTVPHSEFLSLHSQIKNAIHGKKLRITLDDDPQFYYFGRVSVLPLTTERNVGMISIECDCEPYKYKQQKTVVSRAVSGSAVITLTNSRKRAVPEIKTTASMTIAFGSFSRATSAGTFTIPELELVEGANTVTVTGTGTITFTWQEGSL